jgi:hypothetical protein
MSRGFLGARAYIYGKEIRMSRNIFTKDNQHFLVVPLSFLANGELDVDACKVSAGELATAENSHHEINEQTMLDELSIYFMGETTSALRSITEKSLAHNMWSHRIRHGKAPDDPQDEPIMRARHEKVLAHVLRSRREQFHVSPVRSQVLICFIEGDTRPDEAACWDAEGNLIPFPRWSADSWAEELSKTAAYLEKKPKRGRPKAA